MEIEFANHDFLITWLLGFGEKVKVLEPKEIAEDIKAVAEKILLRYNQA